MSFIETLMLLLAAALGQPNLPFGPPPSTSQHAPDTKPEETKPEEKPQAHPETTASAHDIAARLRREQAKKISNGF